MNSIFRQRWRTQLMGSCVIALLTLPIYGDPPNLADRTKGDVVEKGTANVVKNSNPAGVVLPADMTKTVRIERPTMNVVRTSGPAPANTATPVGATDNPTVKAGEVKWHTNFAEACAASKKSGKPVLLFHMMGQLDKQFC
jgi:hypothetical protein